MKLSEAMRAGIAVTEPVRWLFFVYASDGQEVVASCALGAAILGSACANRAEMLREYPALRRHVDGFHGSTVLELIMFLDDNGIMTREQIADFIAWLEDGGAL